MRERFDQGFNSVFFNQVPSGKGKEEEGDNVHKKKQLKILNTGIEKDILIGKIL